MCGFSMQVHLPFVETRTLEPELWKVRIPYPHGKFMYCPIHTHDGANGLPPPRVNVTSAEGYHEVQLSLAISLSLVYSIILVYWPSTEVYCLFISQCWFLTRRWFYWSDLWCLSPAKTQKGTQVHYQKWSFLKNHGLLVKGGGCAENSLKLQLYWDPGWPIKKSSKISFI